MSAHFDFRTIRPRLPPRVADAIPSIIPAFRRSMRKSARGRPLFAVGLTDRFHGGGCVRAVVSEENTVVPSSSGTGLYKLNHLEGSSWLWDVGGYVFLVDPILLRNLDFGIPWLYDAAKKFLKGFRLDDLPVIVCLLITQSLDDHCHLKTLKPLSESLPDLRVVTTPMPSRC